MAADLGIEQCERRHLVRKKTTTTDTAAMAMSCSLGLHHPTPPSIASAHTQFTVAKFGTYSLRPHDLGLLNSHSACARAALRP